MNTSRRLLYGAALRAAVLFANLAAGFFLMPFLVYGLGEEWYGFWMLIGSIMSFYGFMDLGVSVAAQRFVAGRLARADSGKVQEIVESVFYIFSVIAVASLLITALGSGIGGYFVEEGETRDVFRIVLLLLGIKFAMSLPVLAFVGVITGKLRYDLSSYVQIGRLALRVSLTVLAVNNGMGLVALAVIAVAEEIFGAIAIVSISKRLAPYIKLRLVRPNRELARSLLNYGKYAFLASVGQRAAGAIDNFVLAGMLGLALVTHYAVAATLYHYVGMLLGSLVGIFIPVFSADHANAQWAQIRKKLLVTTELSTTLSILMSAGLIISGPLFIEQWMGANFLDAYIPMAILVGALSISDSQRPATAVLYAIAKHRFSALESIVLAVAKLILALILVPRMGLIGMAIAAALPSTVSRLLVVPAYVCKQVEMPVWRYYRLQLRLYVAGIGLMLPLYWVLDAIRPQSLLLLFLICGLYAVVYLVLAINLQMSADTRKYINTAMPEVVGRVYARLNFRDR